MIAILLLAADDAPRAAGWWRRRQLQHSVTAVRSRQIESPLQPPLAAGQARIDGVGMRQRTFRKKKIWRNGGVTKGETVHKKQEGQFVFS